MRKYLLAEDRVYHVFTKSIAGFEVFRSSADYERMKGILKYYQVENPPLNQLITPTRCKCSKSEDERVFP